jgi:hypothetical protein
MVLAGTWPVWVDTDPHRIEHERMNHVGDPERSRIPLFVALAAGPVIVILARWPHVPQIAFNPYDLLVWGRGPGTDLIACIALYLACKSVRRVWRKRGQLLADRP